MRRAADKFWGQVPSIRSLRHLTAMLSGVQGRVGKGWVALVLVATLGAAIAMPVLAQQGPGKGQWRERQMERQEMREQFRGRDPRGPQMSPEERRDLRRDIITHGREHYRAPGRPPPPPPRRP